MNRFRVGALAFVAVPVLTLGGSLGQASAQPAGGFEHSTIVETSPTAGLVIAYGAYNASGTFVAHPTSNTTGTSTATFPNGTTTGTNVADPGGSFNFDPVACVAQVSGSGDSRTTGGTGAYAGIDGHGEYTYKGTVVFAHTATGCGKQPIGALVVIQAQGPVSFG